MKLTGRDARAFLDRPDPGRAGILIFGADGMRVALRRRDVVAALAGPDAEAEMRLARLAGADLIRDPAALSDAVKAQGFFPGHRVVLVEGATDGTSDTFAMALSDWRAGDAQIVATAGSLPAKSKLRKVFEAGRTTVCIGLYDDPPTRDEIEAALAAAGMGEIATDAMRDLEALARSVDPGEFRQTLDRIALYKLGDDTALTSAEVAQLAPASTEAGVDALLDLVADRRADRIGPHLARLRAQGITPVAISIAATRHFKTLLTAASDPKGPAAGIARMRPPVYGPRRDRMQRQAQAWGARRLEEALTKLIEVDLALRSSAPVPGMALVERELIRLGWPDR